MVKRRTMKSGFRAACEGVCGKMLPPSAFPTKAKSRYGFGPICRKCVQKGIDDAARRMFLVKEAAGEDLHPVRQVKRCFSCGRERLMRCFKRNRRSADGVSRACLDCLKSEALEKKGFDEKVADELQLLPMEPSGGPVEDLILMDETARPILGGAGLDASADNAEADNVELDAWLGGE